ncbi:hypothetical protein D3C86_552800 [compost metagenome]
MHPGGHEVVAGALGRALGEDGGLDFEEAVLRHGVADDAVHLAARDHGLLHPGLAQVEVAVAQARGLVDLGLAVFHLEGQGLGRVVDDELVGVDLDLARGEPGIGHAFGAGPDDAGDADDVLVAQTIRELMGVRGEIRLEDHLHDARPVAKVDEDHPSMVPARVHPAKQRHPLANLVQLQGAAVLAALTKANRRGNSFHDPAPILGGQTGHPIGNPRRHDPGARPGERSAGRSPLGTNIETLW